MTTSPNDQRHVLVGAACVVLGALLWSTGGVVIKELGQPALVVSAARSLLSAGLFLLLCGGRVAPPATGRRWFWIGALCYAWVVTGFVAANRLTTAANTILLQFTSPFWIILLGEWFLKEKPRRGDWAALALGAVGIVLCLAENLVEGFSRREGVLLTPETIGDLMALSTGLTFGVCLLVMRRTNRRGVEGVSDAGDARPMLFWGNALAVAEAVAWVGARPPEGGLSAALALTPLSVALLLWLGLGQLGGGYYFVQRGMRHLTAIQASVLTLVEPVLNPLWVALINGERPGGLTVLGGALVLSGMVVNVAAHRAPKPR